MVSLEIFFPKVPTEPCALGSTQPLKMGTRKTRGGKGGRCVPYHLNRAESRDDPGVLTSWKCHIRLVEENLLPHSLIVNTNGDASN
jgi:hypothetical protein